MKSYFNHHCVLKLNLSILMPIILIPNCQLVSSKHTAGLLVTRLDLEMALDQVYACLGPNICLWICLWALRPTHRLLLSSSSFLSQVSLLLLFDVSSSSLVQRVLEDVHSHPILCCASRHSSRFPVQVPRHDYRVSASPLYQSQYPCAILEEKV